MTNKRQHLNFISCATALLVCASIANASGFRPGELIIGGGNQIVLLDPTTGDQRIAFETSSFAEQIYDLAYSSATDSIVFVTGEILAPRELTELRVSGGAFTSSVLLSELSGTESVATALDGSIYFDQTDFVDHDLWRFRDGELTQVSSPAFGTLFVPSDLEVSLDGSQVYASNVPSNNLQVFDLATGALTHEWDLSWPQGLALTPDGSILVAEGGPGDPLPDRISEMDPLTGSKNTWAQQHWMEFLGTGFWGDLEYDTAIDAVYAVKGSSVYAINDSAEEEVIYDGLGWIRGLDLIPGSLVRSPGDFNGDGTLDAGDIDLLSAQVRSGLGGKAFDLNADGDVDELDRAFWVHDLQHTYYGDADLGGTFDSSDLVHGLAFGEYEDAVTLNSSWRSGDFSGDGDFDSADLVLALADGGYDAGARQAVTVAVPEPNSCCLMLAALGVSLSLRGRDERWRMSA